ncbi:hypothetical protein DFH06DRAFT_1132130 [Mycena polygramma]|nr:hypothetical protein DFH06DRAFT_1132130 [Mycena polygramma]
MGPTRNSWFQRRVLYADKADQFVQAHKYFSDYLLIGTAAVFSTAHSSSRRAGASLLQPVSGPFGDPFGDQILQSNDEAQRVLPVRGGREEVVLGERIIAGWLSGNQQSWSLSKSEITGPREGRVQTRSSRI